MKFIYQYLENKAETAEKTAKIIGDTIQEIDRVETVGVAATGVVTGKITDIQKHPNADRLVITTIDIGSDCLDIVTGAPNVAVGQIVPLALPGAKVLHKDGDDIKTVTIEPTVLRGISSNGMLCGADELGLQPDFTHGIHVFDPSTPIGKKVEEIIPSVSIIETDDKGTGHRPELLSYLGLEADLTAVLGKKNENKFPDALKAINLNKINVKIEDQNVCPTFAVAEISGIKNDKTPDWLKKFLLDHEINLINLPTDITNFVTLKFGMPTHVFDANCLKNHQISIGYAKDSTEIEVLNHKKYQLTSSDLAIKSGDQALDIAGIIGGIETKTSASSKNIILTAGMYSPKHIRNTSRRLALRTDASLRFDRGLSTAMVLNGFTKALELILQLTQGKVTFCTAEGKNEVEFTKIENTPERINQILGTNIDHIQINNYLSNLGYQISSNSVIAPWWRSDVKTVADVAEDVARIYGYNKIVAEFPKLHVLPKQSKIDLVHSIIRQSAINLAYEVETNVFVKERNNNSVEVENPIGDLRFMRTAILPELFKLAAYQYRNGNTDFNIFEIGNVYIKSSDKLPAQPRKIAAVFETGENDAKRFLANILVKTNIDVTKVKFSQDEGTKTDILVANKKIGTLEIVEKYHAKFYGFEIQIDDGLVHLSKSFNQYVKTPVVKRDLTVKIDPKFKISDIFNVISLSSNLLLPITLGYRYEKEMSITIHLEFQDSVKTLSDVDVEKEMIKIINALKDKFKAEVR